MKLHLVYGSPNCRKVQAVVHDLGLQPEIVTLDFARGEHKAPAYLALNPNGLVPTLEDGDLVLWESNAIAQYLVDASGGSSLLPADPAKRADVTRWQSWELAHFGRALAIPTYERVFKRFTGSQPDEARANAGAEEFGRFAGILDRHLQRRRFVTGDTLTLADYCLASQLPLAPYAGLDLRVWPALVAWYGRVSELPAWRATAMPAPMAAGIAHLTGVTPSAPDALV